MDEIKVLIEEKIKQLLRDVTDDGSDSLSFSSEEEYFKLISEYIVLRKGIGE